VSVRSNWVLRWNNPRTFTHNTFDLCEQYGWIVFETRC